MGIGTPKGAIILTTTHTIMPTLGSKVRRKLRALTASGQHSKSIEALPSMGCLIGQLRHHGGFFSSHSFQQAPTPVHDFGCSGLRVSEVF